MSTNGRLCPGEAVVVTNERGTILSVSPVFERFTGFNRYEVVGQRLRVNAKAPFGDSSADQAAAWACPTSECTQTGMVCYSKKDGTPFQVTAMISPLRGACPGAGQCVRLTGLEDCQPDREPPWFCGLCQAGMVSATQ